MNLSESDIRNLIKISLDLTEGVVKKVMSKPRYQENLFKGILAEYTTGGLKNTRLKTVDYLIKKELLPHTSLAYLTDNEVRYKLNLC